MFPMKKVGAVDCSDACSPFERQPCGSRSCRCIPIVKGAGYCKYPSSPDVMKMVEEHPNLCQSHAECTKKGSGSFCAHYPNPEIEYGWCFASNYEAQDFFSKIASNSKYAQDFLKMPATATA